MSFSIENILKDETLDPENITQTTDPLVLAEKMAGE